MVSAHTLIYSISAALPPFLPSFLRARPTSLRKYSISINITIFPQLEADFLSCSFIFDRLQSLVSNFHRRYLISNAVLTRNQKNSRFGHS